MTKGVPMNGGSTTMRAQLLREGIEGIVCTVLGTR